MAILWLAAGPSGAQGGDMRFTDVTAQAGITHSHEPPPLPQNFEELARQSIGGAAAAEDFDGDGWVDIFFYSPDTSFSRLYMNNGDGTFTDEASERGAALSVPWSRGAAAADYDNDGDIDICVTFQTAPHFLLINDGTGHFSVDSTTLMLPPIQATSPSFGDVDGDGLLELVIGAWFPPEEDDITIAMYRNLGGGELQPYEFHETPRQDKFIFSPRFADVNGDMRSDLLLASDFVHSQLYFNIGDGMFRNVTELSGTGDDENGMGSAIGDYDNDGDLDWFVSAILNPNAIPDFPTSLTGNRLYRNRGDGIFDIVTVEAGVLDGNWGWGASFGDLDLDGDLDLFHVNGWADPVPTNTFSLIPPRLFENLGDGTFNEVAAEAGVDDLVQGRGAILCDFDNDGDLDIFITHNGTLISLEEPDDQHMRDAPTLYRNDTVTENHWLKVTLRGREPFHRNGIGARIYVTAGGRTQMRELHASTNFMVMEPGRIAHFGLGDALVVDKILVHWGRRAFTTLTNVSVDQHLNIVGPDNAALYWEAYE